jgi:raffinose/stachyose/melibiose transport system permease protein
MSNNQLVKKISIYLFLGVFSLLAFGPYVWVFLSSFKSNSEIFRSPFSLPEVWGLKNYINAWDVGRFSFYYKNTLFVTFMSVLVYIPLVSLAAYPFAKVKFKGKKIFMGLLLFGLAIPFQSIMVSLYIMIKNLYILNTFSAIILPIVSIQIPFGIFYMRAFFQTIPSAIIDAGRVDGASELRILSTLIMPISKSAIISLCIVQTVFAWNAFMIPLLYANTNKLRTITVGLMYFSGEYSTNYTLYMAGAIIVSIPIIIIFIIFRRGFIKGLAAGSVK